MGKIAHLRWDSFNFIEILDYTFNYLMVLVYSALVCASENYTYKALYQQPALLDWKILNIKYILVSLNGDQIRKLYHSEDIDGISWHFYFKLLI